MYHPQDSRFALRIRDRSLNIPHRVRSAGSHSPSALQYRVIIPVKPSPQGSDNSVKDKERFQTPEAGHTLRTIHETSTVFHTTLISNLSPLSINSTRTHIVTTIAKLTILQSIISASCNRPSIVRFTPHNISLNEEGGRSNILLSSYTLCVL